MAESFVQKRRRELGLDSSPSGPDLQSLLAQGKGPIAPEKPMSFVEKRRIELGLDQPTEQYKQEYTPQGQLEKAGLSGTGLTNALKNMASKPKAMPTPPATPSTEKKSSGIKGLANKLGVTKALEVANKVFNAPGEAIKSADKAAQNLVKKLPGAGKGKPLYSNGESVGQHLQDTVGKLDIPGVTSGPIANFIRGAADASDFGTGRALDQILGNQQALEGRNTKAAKYGEIAGTIAPFAPLGVKAAKATVKGVTSLAKGGKQAIEELGDVATGGMNSGITAGATRPSQAASPTIKHIVSSNQKVRMSPSQTAEKAYIDMVDDIYRLKTADEIAKQAKGRELNPTESSYQLAMASRGSDQIAKQLLLKDFVDAAGNVTGGEGLKSVLKDVGRANIREFEDYLLNRHAPTRYARGEKVFPDSMKWTPEMGQKIVADYEAKYPKFKEAADKLEQFQDNLNQNWLVDTGLISADTVKKWKEENPFYIDMKRQFSDLEKGNGGVTRAKNGFGGQNAPVKGYNKYGSQRKIIQPIESIINKVDATVKAAKRNQPMQALVRNIQAHPEEFRGLAEIVPDAPKLENIKNIDMSTPEGLDDLLNRFDETYTNALKSSRKDLNNVVPVMIDGKPVYVKINDRMLLDAVMNLTPQTLDGFTGLAARITNLWKGVLTGVNPIFTLTRSIFRDPVSAYVQSKTAKNPFTFVGDLASAAWAVMKDKDLYKEFKNIGGGYTSPNIGTPSLLNRSKREILPDDKKLKGIVQRFGYGLAEALDRIESVPRLAEYKRLRGSGTLDEKLRGLYESQEVTTNFKRKGAKIRSWDAIFPYLNASIQGLDKIGRTIKDQPGAALIKAAATVSIPSVALYYLNANDPAYQDLRDDEKDRYLHIPVGNGKLFRYPLPPELAPFANVPRRILDQMRGQNPDAWNDFGKNLITNLVPPGLSGGITGFQSGGFPGAAVGIMGDTFLGPGVDVAANKSWTGSPIVPGNLEEASPKYQSDANTSKLAKQISKLTGGSPIQLDYLIKQYGGDFGNIATSLSDKGIKTGGKGIIQGVGKRLVVDSGTSNRVLDDFYNLKDKYDQMKKDIDVGGNVPKGYNDQIRLYLGRTADDISELSTKIKQVDKLASTPKEREELKKQLTQLRTNAARQARDMVKSINK